MSFTTVMCFCIGATFIGTATDSPDVKKDLEMLQGKWVLVSNNLEGRETSLPPLPEGAFLTFRGELLEVRELKDGEETKHGPVKFRLNRDGKQYQIDLIAENGAITAKGLYSVSGDEFKLCAGHDKTVYPTEFKTEPGSRTTISAFKRLKE